MRGIPLPDREEDFTADASELFFDLVFVFAFSRLVYLLVHEPTWQGIGKFALLLAMIWLPWTQFTWSANAVAGNTRPVRSLFLVATIASLPMAAGVTTAFGDGGPAFAVSSSVILAMGLLTMFAGLGDEPGVRASIIRYSIPNWIAIALMVIGSFLDRQPRTVAWLAWRRSSPPSTGRSAAGRSSDSRSAPRSSSWATFCSQPSTASCCSSSSTRCCSSC
jgi:low temperature requirement protein LtrA